MLKTSPTRFVVTDTLRSYIRLEVLGGPDKGIRVTVPRYHPEYSDEVKRAIERMSEGALVHATLVSDLDESPIWRVEKIN